MLLRGSVMDVQSTPSPARSQNLNFPRPLAAKMREYVPCFLEAREGAARQPTTWQRHHAGEAREGAARQPTTWQRHHAAASPTADNPAASRSRRKPDSRLYDCGSRASIVNGAAAFVDFFAEYFRFTAGGAYAAEQVFAVPFRRGGVLFSAQILQYCVLQKFCRRRWSKKSCVKLFLLPDQ